MRYLFLSLIVCLFLITPVLAADPIYIYSPDTVIVDGVEVGSEPVALAFDGSRPLAGGYYVDVVTSQLGDLLIYIPVNYVDGYLTYTESGNLFNLSSSTVTCIAFTENGTQYSVRFSSFAEPQYRLYDYQVSTWYDLTVSEVSDTNVRILSEDAPQPIPQYVLLVLALVLIGGILICVFWKL